MRKLSLDQALYAITFLCLFANLSSCTKESTRDGTIEAAVGPTCGTAVNFSGTHVFAYKETSGAFSGMLLVGGYHSGDAKEMGFYLPWPPVAGTYSFTAGNSGYYDPVNSPSDPLNSSDQYGTTGTGTVTIQSVSLASDNITVQSIQVKLNNIQVQNFTSSDILCINNGTIGF